MRVQDARWGQQGTAAIWDEPFVANERELTREGLNHG